MTALIIQMKMKMIQLNIFNENNLQVSKICCIFALQLKRKRK